jgi:hypothetical protein
MSRQQERKQVKEFYNGYHEERDEQGIVYVTNGVDTAKATLPLSSGLSLSYRDFMLLKELSYEDGVTDPKKGPSMWEFEQFIKAAITEKIERCLQDYSKLGELYSRRLQRTHYRLITLEDTGQKTPTGIAIIQPKGLERQRVPYLRL